MGREIEADVEDRCELILSWARDHDAFDTTMVESILEQYRRKGDVSPKQVAAIDNIIEKFRIQE